jgi:hypothetical protein
MAKGKKRSGPRTGTSPIRGPAGVSDATTAATAIHAPKRHNHLIRLYSIGSHFCQSPINAMRLFVAIAVGANTTVTAGRTIGQILRNTGVRVFVAYAYDAQSVVEVGAIPLIAFADARSARIIDGAEEAVVACDALVNWIGLAQSVRRVADAERTERIEIRAVNGRTRTGSAAAHVVHGA